MKVERHYCDFCGKQIFKEGKHNKDNEAGEIVIQRNNQQFSISSFENCFECFNKVYKYVKGLKQDFTIVIEEKSTK